MSRAAIIGWVQLGLVGLAIALVAREQPAAAQAGAPEDAAVVKGRMLFTDYGCVGCHTLADAGAEGRVGPSFDGNANLSEDFVVERVTNGQGQMPSFSSQLKPDEIKTVASYVVRVAKK